MTNAENRTQYYIAPVSDPCDRWAAGIDGNSFATEDDARAAIPELAEALSTDPDYWTVSVDNSYTDNEGYTRWDLSGGTYVIAAQYSGGGGCCIRRTDNDRVVVSGRAAVAAVLGWDHPAIAACDGLERAEQLQRRIDSLGGLSGS